MDLLLDRIDVQNDEKNGELDSLRLLNLLVALVGSCDRGPKFADFYA
jgi:hypothetical protein